MKNRKNSKMSNLLFNVATSLISWCWRAALWIGRILPSELECVEDQRELLGGSDAGSIAAGDTVDMLGDPRRRCSNFELLC